MENLVAQLFLNRYRPLIETNRVRLDPRNRKTYDFMAEINIDFDGVINILKDLKSSHYYKGPEEDRNGSPGTIMIFLYPYKGLLLYIKLKIIIIKKKDMGIVISFHKEGTYD